MSAIGFGDSREMDRLAKYQIPNTLLPGSAEICALDALAEVRSIHLHHTAHFMQTGAHTFGDAIAQRFIAGSVAGRLRSRPSEVLHFPRRKVGKISGDDGGLPLVITAVQDMANGVPYPFRWLHST